MESIRRLKFTSTTNSDFALDDGSRASQQWNSYDARDMWRLRRRQELNMSVLDGKSPPSTFSDSFKAELFALSL
jgi:hypothetical protein